MTVKAFDALMLTITDVSARDFVAALCRRQGGHGGCRRPAIRSRSLAALDSRRRCTMAGLPLVDEVIW